MPTTRQRESQLKEARMSALNRVQECSPLNSMPTAVLERAYAGVMLENRGGELHEELIEHYRELSTPELIRTLKEFRSWARIPCLRRDILDIFRDRNFTIPDGFEEELRENPDTIEVLTEQSAP